MFFQIHRWMSFERNPTFLQVCSHKFLFLSEVWWKCTTGVRSGLGQFWRNGGRKSFRQSKAPKKPSVISNYYLSKQNPDTPSLKKTAPWTLYKPKPFSVGFGHKGAQVTPSLWDGSIGLKDHKLTEKAWAIDLKIYQYKLQKCGIVCLQSMILHLP